MIARIIKAEVYVITYIGASVNNGDRTECSSLIRPVIMRVINKIRRPRNGSPIC